MSESETEARTVFDKIVDVERGDDLEIMGEKLTAAYVDVSACEHRVGVYGAHEELDKKPRYEITADARHNTVEIYPVRGN